MKPFKWRLLCSDIFIVILSLLSVINNGSAYMVGNNPFHRRENLDGKGKYQLEWEVDWTLRRVIFNVTVETKGYIGFGFSNKGKMTGADIVIGGVSPDGRSYFSDRHAVANQLPEEDSRQDWTLHAAHETAQHTFLCFSRAFDTCDPQDYPITEDKLSLIWAYGERDSEFAYHHEKRGEYPVYLLHRDYTLPIVHNRFVGARASQPVPSIKTPSNLKIWTIHTQLVIPASDTTYWCTIHKAPVLPRKHHVVGYEVRFDTPQSRQHVHHLALHRCGVPPGRTASQTFSAFIRHPGQVCYNLKTPFGPIPTELCPEYFSVFGVGGRPIFYPPHVGFPFGENPDEFYLLQVHYDNPNQISNVPVNITVDYYYTSDLRPHDGAILDTRHDSPGVTPSLLIPPSSIDHKIYGICGRDCTQKILPRDGIRIFGILLHSHNTGVRLRMQHFRKNRELPWIQSDDNYAFDFQQGRMLKQEVKVVPGDLLAARCTYDSSAVLGTVVGGFSSQQEMCVSFMFYYSRIPNYSGCSSEIDSDGARQRFLGIGNVTWSVVDLEYIVNEPPALAGLKVSEVSDNHVEWTVDRRERFDRFHLEETHLNSCPEETFTFSTTQSGQVQSVRTPVDFPYEAQPYRPRRSCSFQD